MGKLMLTSVQKNVLREMYEESKKNPFVSVPDGTREETIFILIKHNLIEHNLIEQSSSLPYKYVVFEENVKKVLDIRDRPARKIKEKV